MLIVLIKDTKIKKISMVWSGILHLSVNAEGFDQEEQPHKTLVNLPGGNIITAS
jgi:hypothetical protein